MKYLVALLALAPVSALAHDGAVAHIHPHGLEISVALAAVAVGFLVWKMTR